jgi:S-adenosylmethionine decarboxylase
MTINRRTLIIKGNLYNNNEVWNNLLQAAHNARLTVLTTVKHDFFPIGFSGVIVLGESHVAIHTFPENNEAWVEIATCTPDDSAIKRFCVALEKFYTVEYYVKDKE